MPSKSTFNHYNCTEKASKKKTFNVSSFFGVEYTRSQLEAKDYHATDIKNIVYRDKVNQKRSGYEQVAKTPINAKINGYFEFYDTNDILHKIMHIGTSLYEVKKLFKGSNFWETKFEQINGTMANHKSMGFASKGILYILDGTKYRYLSVSGTDSNYTFTLANVVGSNIVYIPTTSLIGADNTITAYEDVNMLTTNRYNKLIGFKYDSDVTNTTYYDLDAPIDVTKIWGSSLVINNNEYLPAIVSSDAYTTDSQGNNVRIFYYVTSSNRTADAITEGVYNYNGSDILVDGVARLQVWRDGNYNSKISITNSDSFLSEVENEITIIFCAYDSVDNSDYINKCTFGIIYNNQLFVSGNIHYKNCDWHTQSIVNYGNSETYGDFTYFSDLDYCYYGSDNTAVVGYDIYGDGDLIVVKEPSRYEATLYRRGKELKIATSYTGEQVSTQKENETYYEEGYPMFPINNAGGDGGISNRSITNFLGNTLILTKNGLKKLYTKQNTYNKEKSLIDVSSNINLAITDKNLSEAFLFTFKDKMYLKIEDYVYVAYDSLKEESEYEWYKLDGINADYFFEIDNELYFSDTNGNICRFNEEEYYFKDRDRIYTGLGSTLPSGNTITINVAYKDKIANGDKVMLLEYFDTSSDEDLSTYTSYRPMYYEIGYFYDSDDASQYTGNFVVENGKTKIILNETNNNFYNGLKVYLNGDNVDGNYILEDKDEILSQEFFLKDSDGQYALFTNSDGFRVYVSTEEKELKVANYDEENLTFTLKNELGEAVTFYTTNAESYSCIITHEKNVECFYETKPYDMGSIGYDKTIWQYTIANDTNLESVTTLGYVANRKQGTYAVAKGNKGLRFEMFEFATVSFLNDGLPHIYTKYRLIPNVNFIRFSFKNEDETNMVLSQLSFIYTISGQVRGSK